MNNATHTRLTPWGETLNPDAVLQEYPRPQLVRNSYANLNGLWHYAITSQETHDGGQPGLVDGEILVPFSPETPLSGVGRQLLPGENLRYWRELTLPADFLQDRVLLHFGAVDQRCTVMVNGIPVGGHRGGFLPFTLDITEALRAAVDGTHILQVDVQDDSDTSYHSRGKQRLKRGGIWYTAQSGIWQTVWLESVPAVHIEKLTLLPDLNGAAVEVTVHATGGHQAEGDSAVVHAVVTISDGAGQLISLEVEPNVATRIPLSRVRPWSPEDPFLYDVAVTLGADRVTSYFGLRSFGVGPDASGVERLLLNGEPYFHAGLLDQGYWSDGYLTAPSDAAIIYDIELAKRLGFTMLRKHIKVEPLRWYYHCDRLGMLVWQDLVNGGTRYKAPVITAPVLLPMRLNDGKYARFGRSDAAGRADFMDELRDTVELLRNMTSLAVWVPFNEAWGQFDALAATAELRWLDPSRTIDHASGWHDQGGGDLKSLHIYFTAFKLRKRWRRDPRAVVLSEYGGYSLRLAGHDFSDREFGYRRYTTQAQLSRAFTRLHEGEIVPAIAAGLSAVVYTQLSDVEDELNGLISYDRKVAKMPDAVVQAVTAQLRYGSTESNPTVRKP
ncbi:glycoside hydrolase family 2 [Arthrobacter psychrolactophilus]|uniref:Glycoside hydrolase family 2 n=1 Tax=Arthrobacter psychrolactophilus TaxID=92442 RepID=A0A2V5JH69_9MICC|nr:sugar-binding domain-containing protein [Arthrobacter psychrolactophilus]PYI39307.1 glycoside hydrolase family 2 [Arthrobacter psychrolactophilus]